MELTKIQHLYDLTKNHWTKILDRYGKPPELDLKTLPKISSTIRGLKRKKLYVVGARPGNHKSNFLIQIGLDLAMQGKNVVFFSFELASEVIAERVLAWVLEVDNYNLEDGSVKNLAATLEFNKKLTDKMAIIDKMPFVAVDSIGNSLPEFNDIINILGKGVKPDVVIIDYGNMVKSEPNRTQKAVYDDYIKGLRATAIRNNFCVVLGAQINRGVANKDGELRPPELTDLKDTGELEQVADVVFLLHWAWLSQAERKCWDKNYIYIKIAKNRDGRTGRRKGTVIPEQGRIYDYMTKQLLEDRKTAGIKDEPQGN